jgi:8-oxo-dGTP pyrophosphatase MutT (NUDIX family)
MEKFTKLKPKTDFEPDKKDIKFRDEYMTVVSSEGWTFVDESDMVVCIPYLIEDDVFLIRQEYIPTFKYVEGQEFHVTVISGTIEKGETPRTTLLRELEEEAGIVLRPDYKVEFGRSLFTSKGTTGKIHPVLLNLGERDYHEVVAKGDGSASEKKSRTVKVSAKHINALIPSDLPTVYMLSILKDHLNMR